MNQLFLKFLHKRNTKIQIGDQEIHLLNKEELVQIKKEYKKALLHASVLGLLGVVLYFIPVTNFDFFKKTYVVELFQWKLDLPIYDLAYSIFLVVVEIYLLTLVHLRLVHHIAIITGYFTIYEKDQLYQKINDVAVQKVNKKAIEFGLDPFQDFSKWLLFTWNLLLKLKGFLASKLIRYFLKRFLGRYAFRYILDLATAPVYMLINAYATYEVYKNAKAEFFGHQLVQLFLQENKDLQFSEVQKKYIYDTLQLIAFSKRDFHTNHSLLTEEIIKNFNIPTKEKHKFIVDDYQFLKNEEKDFIQFCQNIFIIGLILDGTFSYREKKKVNELNQKGIFNLQFGQLKLASKQFISGEKITLLNS